MKKILVLLLATFTLSFLGFAKSFKAVTKNSEGNTKSNNVLHLGFTKFQKKKEYFDINLKAEVNSANLPTCYSFGYETQCTLPGTCINYTICDAGFSVVWAMHLVTDYNLSRSDCRGSSIIYI